MCATVGVANEVGDSCLNPLRPSATESLYIDIEGRFWALALRFSFPTFSLRSLWSRSVPRRSCWHSRSRAGASNHRWSPSWRSSFANGLRGPRTYQRSRRRRIRTTAVGGFSSTGGRPREGSVFRGNGTAESRQNKNEPIRKNAHALPRFSMVPILTADP
jgi:hypothetical protein